MLKKGTSEIGIFTNQKDSPSLWSIIIFGPKVVNHTHIYHEFDL